MSNAKRIGYALGKLAASSVNFVKAVGDATLDVADEAIKSYADKKMDKFMDAQHELAMQNPEYAEIENKRIVEDSDHIILSDSSLGLGMDEWEKQMEISNEVMPDPILMPLWRFLYNRPLRTGRNVVVHTFQRLTRSWDDKSTWSLDTSLCKTLGEQLIHLSKVSHGYPSGGEYNDYDLWISDLKKHGKALLAYGSHWEIVSMEDKDVEALLKEAQKSLHWVAEHLPSLWD